jgi:hypothetical protein
MCKIALDLVVENLIGGLVFNWIGLKGKGNASWASKAQHRSSR